MYYRTMYAGEQVPALGLGTWRLGGSMTPDYSHDRQNVELIQHAIQLGYTHIDTAEIYGNGHTEELIGRAIQRFPREDLLITTKVWHTNLRHPDVLRAVDNSLRRLHTTYVDWCLVHWPNQSVALSETFAALNKLVEDGKVRYLGVSNFNLEQLREAERYAATPIVTNQVPYSLYNRTHVKNGMLKYCREKGILLTAYSPFDRGVILQNPVLEALAQRYEVTPAQLALHWLLRQEAVITIPMTSRWEHLESNLAALRLDLGDEDLVLLDEVELPEEALWPE